MTYRTILAGARNDGWIPADDFKLDSRRIATVKPRECDRPYCHSFGDHVIHVVGSCAQCDTVRNSSFGYLADNPSALANLVNGYPLDWLGL